MIRTSHPFLPIPLISYVQGPFPCLFYLTSKTIPSITRPTGPGQGKRQVLLLPLCSTLKLKIKQGSLIVTTSEFRRILMGKTFSPTFVETGVEAVLSDQNRNFSTNLCRTEKRSLLSVLPHGLSGCRSTDKNVTTSLHLRKTGRSVGSR